MTENWVSGTINSIRVYCLGKNSKSGGLDKKEKKKEKEKENARFAFNAVSVYPTPSKVIIFYKFN